MKETWNVLKLGVYVFALPLVATAAASAHQWMSSSAAIAIVPPPAVVNNSSATRINALRNHTVTINEDGEVQGRVSAISHKTKNARGISEAAVYFIQDGEIVLKSYTNDDGTFVIKGLEEGIYSFVSAGEFSFATCGVNLVKSDGNVENYLEVAAITPNVKAIQEIIESGLPESIKEELNRSFASIDVRPANVVGTNRVELDGDVLRGQIVSLFSNNVENTKAHLFRGNTKVKEFEVAANGSFEINSVTAGVYDIVAVGPHGLAAVSFEAVAEADESSDAYTSLQGPALFSSFVVALAPQADGGCISGCCGGCGSNAIVYGDSPVGFLGDRLGGGIAGGGCCGAAGNFGGFGGGIGGVGGRFGGLFGGAGAGRLLLPAIAAGIAIPLATSSASETDVN